MSLQAVTGAYGYSGRYIASRLLEQGSGVITLTGSAHRGSGLAGRVPAFPLDFDQPNRLAETLRGVSVLYNTYWVRFNHRLFDHERAVADSEVLFQAARRAGVERVVHVSITNPSLDSPLSYFRGKARVESALKESGMSYAILRPAVLFGNEDILINNIAWALRTLPVFGIFGDGTYGLCPIHVEDLAEAAVRLGSSRDNIVVDAVGPEKFTYRKLVDTVAGVIGVHPRVIHVPGWLGWIAGRLIGCLHGDVMITMDEIRGLTAGLLMVDSKPLGSTSLTDWMTANSETLGRRYASELARRVKREECGSGR